MPETMEMETATTPICPCGKPMGFQEDKTWRCLACNPMPMNTPKCATQKCLRPLTKLGPPWNCWICLHCNEHPDVVNKRNNKTEQPERKYVDTTLTKDNVKEMIKEALSGVGGMVREAMSEFSLKEEPDPDYPPPRAEINQIAESVKQNAVPVEKPETWRQKAKNLGISLMKEPKGTGPRKKEDVLADIAKHETI